MSEEELNIALQIVKKAGIFLREGFRETEITVRRKGDASPVTEYDLTSNEMITNALRETFPDHVILSEEDPNAENMLIDDRPTWIIDPLDGTSNFIAGIPLFGIAVAHIVEGEPKIGIIYDPIHDDMFIAEKGKGAKMNGKPITVSTHNSIRRAMLVAGRGYKERDRVRHGKIIFELEQVTSYFRRFGTAAIMLASVAAGRADAVILTGNQSWDMAAGALLIREAGGTVTEYSGRPWVLGSEDLVATNGIIHDELVSITSRTFANEEPGV